MRLLLALLALRLVLALLGFRRLLVDRRDQAQLLQLAQGGAAAPERTQVVAVPLDGLLPVVALDDPKGGPLRLVLALGNAPDALGHPMRNLLGHLLAPPRRLGTLPELHK
jgi:hypothetical protein